MKYRLREVIDKRHDHSFRIHRPDTSVKLGTPNACNDCHADQSAQWAADTIEQWHGPTRNGFQNYAKAFQASWTGRSDAAAQLTLVAASPTTPAIARASALSELHSRVSPASIELARKGLADPDPMVRNAALDMLDGHPGNRIWQLVSPLLTDSSRGFRIRQFRYWPACRPQDSRPPIARLSRVQQPSSSQRSVSTPIGRKPGRHLGTSLLVAASQRCRERNKAALPLSPQFAPAAINLADLYRQLGREGDAETVLRTATASSRQDAGTMRLGSL
jgi:hypothetical protein